jgi:hypothetical protein
MEQIILKNLCKPTCVKQCVAAFLTHSKKNSNYPANLMVGFEDCIEVYRVQWSLASKKTSNKYNFVKIESVAFYDSVLSITILNSSTPDYRDGVIITFQRTNCVISFWDTTLNGLKVSSIHSWDYNWKIDVDKKAYRNELMIRCDRNGQFVIILIRPNKIAVIQSDSVESTTFLPDIMDSIKKLDQLLPPIPICYVPAKPSHIINVGKKGMGPVLDIDFLSGYEEPVLAILHELRPTWNGVLNQRKDTCALTIIRIQTNNKFIPILLWTEKGLPYDSKWIASVASPYNGTLLFTSDLILYRSRCASNPLPYGVSMHVRIYFHILKSKNCHATSFDSLNQRKSSSIFSQGNKGCRIGRCSLDSEPIPSMSKITRYCAQIPCSIKFTLLNRVFLWLKKNIAFVTNGLGQIFLIELKILKAEFTGIKVNIGRNCFYRYEVFA